MEIKKKKELLASLMEEYENLKTKFIHLNTALDDEKFIKKVSETQLDLLYDQVSAMRLYLKALHGRIEDISAQTIKNPNPDIHNNSKGKEENENIESILSDLFNELKDLKVYQITRDVPLYVSTWTIF